MAVSVSIGPRLQLVAAYVPKGCRLGDIGTDHAYLPIYLWENGKIEKAVAVDVHEGPYRSACTAVQSRGLQGVIDVRYGDGLKPLCVGEVDTLTLAGMGGNTMLEIFAARPDIMREIKDLVLQPQGAEGKVRLAMLEAGWRLQKEEYVAEEGRIYVVMHYSRQEGYNLEDLLSKVHKCRDRVLASYDLLEKGSEKGEFRVSPEEGEDPLTQNQEQDHQDENIEDMENVEKIITKWIWEWGPLALENPSAELRELIQDQIRTLERTIGEMQKSNQEKVQKRIREYLLSIKVLEVLAKCLFPLA